MYSNIMLLDKKKYSAPFYLVSGVGASLILVLGIATTYALWQVGVKEDIFTSNFATSLFLTDTLRTASGAAPLALVSINAFACRMGVKRFRKWAKHHFA